MINNLENMLGNKEQFESRYEQMATNLGEVLNTLVSVKLLELLSDKQMGLLDYQYKLIKGLRNFEMDDEDRADEKRYLETIKSVLDSAKNKIPKHFTRGTAEYNKVTN